MIDLTRERIFHELEDVDYQIQDLEAERRHLEEELNNQTEDDSA